MYSDFIADKIVMEGLTFDDVLLVPAYSEVLPRTVSLSTKFSRNIDLQIPFVTAAMDTVTEAPMAIAIAREGGIGVIHKNMSIEDQARQVAIVKRAENGMIYDPVTIQRGRTVKDALALMREYAKPRERPLPIGSPTVPTPRVIAGSRTYAPNGYAAAVRAWNKPFFIRCLSRRKKENQRLPGAVRRIFSMSAVVE